MKKLTSLINFDSSLKKLNLINYGKSIIRCDFLKNSKTVMVDNHLDYNYSPLLKKIKKTPNFFGLNSTIYHFKSKLNRDIDFFLNLPVINCKTPSLFGLNKTLNLIKSTAGYPSIYRSTSINVYDSIPSKSFSIILLRPIRGGFKCFSSGLLGFLPLASAKYAFRKIYGLNRFPFEFLSDKNYNIFRIASKKTSVFAYPFFSKKKFVKRFKVKKRKASRLNAVFLVSPLKVVKPYVKFKKRFIQKDSRSSIK